MTNYDIMSEAGDRAFDDNRDRENLLRTLRKTASILFASAGILLGGCAVSSFVAQDRQIASGVREHLQGELKQVRRLYTTSGKQDEAVALAKHALGTLGRAQNDSMRSGFSTGDYSDLRECFLPYVRN